LRRERPDEVGVGLAHPCGERLAVGLEGVKALLGEFVACPGSDGSRAEPDRLQTLDDLALRVEDGDVAVTEQFGDQRRGVIAALELEDEDAVEAVLLDRDEVGTRDAVAQHHREVGRAPGRVRDVFGVGGVGTLPVAHLDEQFDATVVVVAHPQPEQVLAVEICLVDGRTPVVPEFGDERGEVDARQFPLGVHGPDSEGEPKRRVVVPARDRAHRQSDSSTAGWCVPCPRAGSSTWLGATPS